MRDRRRSVRGAWSRVTIGAATRGCALQETPPEQPQTLRTGPAPPARTASYRFSGSADLHIWIVDGAIRKAVIRRRVPCMQRRAGEKRGQVVYVHQAIVQRGSWRSCIRHFHLAFITDGRLAGLEQQGKGFRTRLYHRSRGDMGSDKRSSFGIAGTRMQVSAPAPTIENRKVRRTDGQPARLLTGAKPRGEKRFQRNSSGLWCSLTWHGRPTRAGTRPRWPCHQTAPGCVATHQAMR